jgi:hypothetical protein
VDCPKCKTQPAEGAQFCSQCGAALTSRPANGREEDRYEACVRALNFELEHFWKRSLFFWGFIGAAFVALAAASDDHPNLKAAIAAFGFFGSFVWTLGNRGDKFWYEHWEEKLKVSEQPITGRLYGEESSERKKDTSGKPFLEQAGAWWFRGKRYSPSKLTIALSDYVTVFWFGVVSYKFTSLLRGLCNWDWWHWHPSKQVFTVIFMGLSVVLALSLRRICHATKNG